MKITKRQLRKIIREAFEDRVFGEPDAMEQAGWQRGTPPEITDANVTEEQIISAWPDVVYKGQNVMDLMYNDEIMNRAQETLAEWEGGDFDGQEGYLGYDRRKDVFVMGFDMWPGGDSSIQAAFVEIDPGGFIVVDEIYDGGGIYPRGWDKIKDRHPEMVDLRLD